jgi:glucokinase
MILAGDVGGTKTLLALFAPAGASPRYEQRLQSRDFADFEALLAEFFVRARAALGTAPRPAHACFGVAGPVDAQRARLTNLPWTFEVTGLAARFGLGRVHLLNDFAAAAWGIDALGPQDLRTLQVGEPLAGAPRVILGAGTGLGLAYAFDSGDGYVPVAGEGGHAAFAPADAQQAALWSFLHERLGRVELEHVLSGPGLARIDEFLGGPSRAPQDASAEALELFVACYGAAAGDRALEVLARGGVYVAGGIAARILPRLAAGSFLAAFNDKGAFAAEARRIPVHVVTTERLGLLGAARAARRFRTRGPSRSTGASRS